MVVLFLFLFFLLYRVLFSCVLLVFFSGFRQSPPTKKKQKQKLCGQSLKS